MLADRSFTETEQVFGLAPYFRNILRKEVQKSDIYVMSFDESLNDVNQKCQMDLIVPYWDEKDNSVKVRYWETFVPWTFYPSRSS